MIFRFDRWYCIVVVNFHHVFDKAGFQQRTLWWKSSSTCECFCLIRWRKFGIISHGSPLSPRLLTTSFFSTLVESLILLLPLTMVLLELVLRNFLLRFFFLSLLLLSSLCRVGIDLIDNCCSTSLMKAKGSFIRDKQSINSPPFNLKFFTEVREIFGFTVAWLWRDLNE